MRPAPLQQNVDAFSDLLLHAVVEIIVHLLDEFVVRQAVEIEFAFVAHESPSLLSAALWPRPTVLLRTGKLVREPLCLCAMVT